MYIHRIHRCIFTEIYTHRMRRFISIEFNEGFVAGCCGVLQCVAVCCSVLPCVAVCCGQAVGNETRDTLQHTATHCTSVLQRAAVYCRMLQCVAVCCGVLQCVAW